MGPITNAPSWGIFLSMNYELDTIATLGTAIATAQDGKGIAALLLPADTEYRYSAARVRMCNQGIIIPKDCSFLKPPTWDELLYGEVRAAMSRNRFILTKMTYEETIKAICMWMKEAVTKHNVKWLRLGYGGDLYGLTAQGFVTTPLTDINKEIKSQLSELDMRIIIRTASIERVDTEMAHLQRYNSLDPRIYVVAETQVYGDMPLFITDRVRYYWEQSAPEDAVEDIQAIPLSATGSGFFHREVPIRIPEAAYKYFTKE